MLGVYRINTHQWFGGWASDKEAHWIDNRYRQNAVHFESTSEAKEVCDRLADLSFAVVVDTLHDEVLHDEW